MTYEFEAIGTHWYIHALHISSSAQQHATKLINERIAKFDKAYSRFLPDSLVTTISKSAGDYTMPADFEDLYKIYEQMYGLTDGAMTPLIGRALAQAGYDADYSLQSRPIGLTPTMHDVLQYTAPLLHVSQPVLLDFGAAGKGYLIDIIATLLQDVGIKHYVIDAGGDIRCRGNKPHRIGLENPHTTSEAIGVIEIKNQSLCGSAGNRRAWGDYTHILNPYTKKSPRDIAAIWVVADTTLVADALTTALQFVPASKLQNDYDFEYFILYANGQYQSSAGWNGVLFK